MNNNRNNGPELDYYELRRRHEQYKSRNRAPQQAEPALEEAMQPEMEQPLRQEPETMERKPRRLFTAKAKPAPAPAPEAEKMDDPALDDELMDELMDEMDGMEDPEAGAEEDASLYENPNPFGSFISAFHSVKNTLSKRGRKGAGRRNAQDDFEDDFDLDFDEDFDAGDFIEDDATPAPEAPVKRRAERRAERAEAETEAAAAAVLP